MKNICNVIGIVDDGWHGLSENARAQLISADLIISASRTYDLVKKHLPNQVQFVSLEKKLSQVPFWVENELELGKNVVVLATGDPLLFGIGSYLLKKIAPEKVEFISALSTMQIAFTRFKVAWQDIKITSCHGRGADEWFFGATPSHGLYNVINTIANNSTVAFFTSPVNTPAKIARAIITAGFVDVKISIACKLMLTDEAVYKDLSAEEVAKGEYPQPNVVLVTRKIDNSQPSFGLPDNSYIQRFPEKGLITKQEVRVLSLAKLQINENSIMWDIGAGSGSVGVEVGRLAKAGHVWAIEKNEVDSVNAIANAKKYGLCNYTLIHGRAPQNINDDWQNPTAVFIGGSGGNLADIINLSLHKLHIGGVLVMNFITLENLSSALEILKSLGKNDNSPITWEITQLSAARSQPILDMHRLAAQNPVWLIRVIKNNEIDITK